jgi:crossover junction endodeoxyribonuclease RuvC
MIILGIDPGFERLGIAVIQKEKGGKETLLFSECFKTKKQDEFTIRLGLVGERIEQIISIYKPDVLAIETLFMETNQKTGMHVAEVRGAILYLCQKSKMHITEYTPLQVKSAITGYGKADKNQMMFMIPKLIYIENVSTSDDELDAIAIALTSIAYNKY